MVLAAVAFLLANTKKNSAAANAEATGSILGVQRPRALGRTTNRNKAAIPARNPATCHPSRLVALIAAPPVENRTAAAKSSSRATAGLPPGSVTGAGPEGTLPDLGRSEVLFAQNPTGLGLMLPDQPKTLGTHSMNVIHRFLR